MNNVEQSIKEIVEQRALSENVSLLYIFGKRAFDIAAASMSFVLLVPLFLVVGIAIKATSPGPVFFKQKRSGFKGKSFSMLKFRSMVSNAEQRFEEVMSKNEVSGYMFKIRNDPRHTKVGKIIRKTSIDELPQLINVIKGEMSIVGPRPPIIREVQKYDSWHNLRLSVKPGITGLWQVSGRNELGFEDMCRLDLKYIRERSFLYDLKVIFKTIPAVFRFRGAS